MKANLPKRLTAEFVGTAMLLAAVVGSGIMAEKLSAGNAALALLANTVATGAALVALILTFGPISGAHLNPAVTICDAWQKGVSFGDAMFYLVVQFAGALLGVAVANTTFGLPVFFASTKPRNDPQQWL